MLNSIVLYTFSLYPFSPYISWDYGIYLNIEFLYLPEQLKLCS